MTNLIEKASTKTMIEAYTSLRKEVMSAAKFSEKTATMRDAMRIAGRMIEARIGEDAFYAIMDEIDER